jgi:hypothetical protein
VVTSDRLYQPGDEESIVIDDPAEIGQRCWLRTERQTLRRLPDTGAVVFTIKVSLKPLAELMTAPQVLRSLSKAIAHLSEPERRYKSLHHLEPALSLWLACAVSEASSDQHAANGVEQ